MIEREVLQEQAENYLRNLISEFSKTVIDDQKLTTPFQELGIDSFHVLKIIRRMEDVFGTLPKTLLFENFNIADLAEYFLRKHESKLQKMFAITAQPVDAGISSNNDRRVDAAISMDRSSSGL